MKRFLVLFVLILWLSSALLCFAELRCIRPLKTVFAMGCVYLLREDSFTIQTSPRHVAIGQPHIDAFLSYMEARGFTHLPEEQMGSTHFFRNGAGEQIAVHYSTNAYFTKWYWED